VSTASAAKDETAKRLKGEKERKEKWERRPKQSNTVPQFSVSPFPLFALFVFRFPFPLSHV
jgi:hypothetical protein